MILNLSREEIDLVIEALDSHGYWQVSEEHERNDGFVYFPAPGTKKFQKGDAEDQERWSALNTIESLSSRLGKALEQDSKIEDERRALAEARAKKKLAKKVRT